MANTFKNAVSAASIGVTATAVYTTPASTTTTVIGLSVANVLTTQIYVDVTLTDTSATKTVYLVKGAPVPVGSSLVVVGGDQKVVMEAGDIIKVKSGTAASADVTVSVLQIA